MICSIFILLLAPNSALQVMLENDDALQIVKTDLANLVASARKDGANIDAEVVALAGTSVKRTLSDAPTYLVTIYTFTPENGQPLYNKMIRPNVSII